MKRPFPSSLVSNLPGAGRLARRSYFVSPASLPSLHSWYDAADTSTITSSAGLVSQWNDKSGNGYHAKQASSTYQPTTGSLTLNGKNVISAPSNAFNSPAPVMFASASVTSNAFTFFCVASKTGAGSSANVYDRILSLYNSSNNLDYESTAKFSVMYTKNAFLGLTPPSVVTLQNNAANTGQTLTYGAANLTICQLNGTAVTLTHNGTTTTGTAIGSAMNSTKQALLGNPQLNADSFLYGYIAEHILYSRVLTAVEIAQVVRYLKLKWGLA